MLGAVTGDQTCDKLRLLMIISAGSLFYQLVLRARPAAEAEPVRPEAKRGHEMSPEYQPSPGVTSTSPDVESQPDR